MANDSLKFCAYYGCRKLLPRGIRFCDEHKAEIEGRKALKIKGFGYKRANWAKVRKERLAYAQYECELKLPGCTFVATHVHLHEDLHGDHDRATLEDTRACCLNCSSSIDGGRAHGWQNS